MNVDIEILNKVSKLNKKYIKRILNPDQVVFISIMQKCFNIHKSINMKGIKNKNYPWLCGPVGWIIIPYTKKAAGLILSQGTYLNCRFNPWPGHVREATNRWFSNWCLSLSLSLPPSLSKINKHILRLGLKIISSS